MELDIHKFLRISDQHQFEFPHFPNSYLHLAAHRVALHYGLQTMAHENVIDGQGTCILAIKNPDTKFPAVCLSDVPVKESENDKLDLKCVIRPRPKASGDSNELGLKGSHIRTVEERKEEYERARARIFSTPSNSESEDASIPVVSEGRILNDVSRNLGVDADKVSREITNSSRVAIFRDREKDRTDPDYDRSYNRYVKSIRSDHGFNLPPMNTQIIQIPLVHYDSFSYRAGLVHGPQPSTNYQTPPLMSPYPAMRLSQASMDAFHMQWPHQSIIYAQSYGHLRRNVFQTPFYQQQPLSFDYSQNHR